MSKTDEKLRGPIYVIGAGALGTYFSHQLSQFHNVVLIPFRKELYQKMKFLSVTLEFRNQRRIPVKTWDRLSPFKPGSTFLISTKAYELRETFDLINNLIRKGLSFRKGDHKRKDPFYFLLCQNGLGLEELLRKSLKDCPHYQWGRLGCWLGVSLEVIQKRPHARNILLNGMDRIEVAGKLDLGYLNFLKGLFGQLNIPLVRLQNVNVLEWKKVFLNGSLNALCSITNSINGRAYRSPELHVLFLSLLRESIEVARRHTGNHWVGVEAKTIESLRKVAANKNSMLQDLEKGRQTEIEWLNGAILRMGKKVGIETPSHEFVYYLIKFIEKNLKSKNLLT